MKWVVEIINLKADIIKILLQGFFNILNYSNKKINGQQKKRKNTTQSILLPNSLNG